MGDHGTPEYIKIFARADKVRNATSSPSSAYDQVLFRLHLETIMNAHLYGHISEAYVLRAIARAIQEFLV